MGKNVDFKDYWPLRAIENNCIISKWGDITVGFEVTLPEIFTLYSQVSGTAENRVETGDFRELVDHWVKAINVLPEYSIVHKQDWFTIDTYDPNQEEYVDFRNSFLDIASTRHFFERQFLNHRCYLFITKTHSTRKFVNTLRTSLISGKFIPPEVIVPHKLVDFFSSVDQFVAIINSTKKINLRRMVGSEFYSGQGKPGLLERYMSLEPIAKVVPLCDIQQADELMVGNKSVKSFGLSDIEDMPDAVYTHNSVDTLSTDLTKVSIGFSSPIGLMLQANHIYNQYIYKTDRKVILPKLESRSQQMTSLASFSKANLINSQRINDYLSYAADTGFSPIRCHFNLLVWTQNQSDWSTLTTDVSSSISKMGIRPRENNVADTLKLFWAGIPGNASDIPDEDKFLTFTQQSCCLLNQESVSASSIHPIGIRVTDRLSGKPLWVDFSDEPMKRGWIPNRNKFILGPSGSGKSFLTNHFVRSYSIQGAHTVIVDVGHSYEGLCSMLGGKYLTFREDDPISFNPFMVEGRVLPDIEKRESIKALLITIWKNEGELLTKIDEVALSLAIKGYFLLLSRDQTIVPCFNSFYLFLEQGFPQLLKADNISAKHFDYDGFMICMRPFYKGGEYDYLLNSTTNINLLEEPFIVFELDNIKDHKVLFPVVTIIIMDTFITKMRKLESVRKIILLEEAWKAIMTPSMASFVKYLYKTVRKHFGEAWLVTQELNDIVGNAIVQDAIVSNAGTKILLDQQKYEKDFSFVQNMLGITEKQKNLILSLNKDLRPGPIYKEFCALFGHELRIYGLEVSKQEVLSYTTEKTDKVAVQEHVLKQGGNWEAGIRSYLEELESNRELANQ